MPHMYLYQDLCTFFGGGLDWFLLLMIKKAMAASGSFVSFWGACYIGDCTLNTRDHVSISSETWMVMKFFGFKCACKIISSSSLQHTRNCFYWFYFHFVILATLCFFVFKLFPSIFTSILYHCWNRCRSNTVISEKYETSWVKSLVKGTIIVP